MFDIDQFIFDCKNALRQERSPSAVHDVVARAVSDPASVLKALSDPQCGEIRTLYRSDDLTILNVIWAPWMTLLPHNHQMWAVIGIYTGREDNIFWRRVEDGQRTKVEAAGAKALGVKDTVPLGRDIIHSVTNQFHGLRAQSTFMAATFLALLGAASGMQKHSWSNLATERRWHAASKKPMPI